MKVGFIGLGTMGRPMALHLQRAGHELFVWVRRPESVAGLPASVAVTAAELGRCCEVVFTIINSSADVEAVATPLYEGTLSGGGRCRGHRRARDGGRAGVHAFMIVWGKIDEYPENSTG